jgi:plastocyanin
MVAAPFLAVAVCALASNACGQATVTVHLSRQPTPGDRGPARPLPPAVLWLMPLQPVPAPMPEAAHPPYVLLQKNRMFEPHVLVVPVGTPVSFPNADPFFHNVFSLYNGRRFDLGLYEKGTDRQVVFSREGVSYIFCNIHPEMSAVVIALKTPWYASAGSVGSLRIGNLPPGEYEAHLWVEGADPHQLEQWTHRVHLTNGSQNVESFAVNSGAISSKHANKFGMPYRLEPKPY